MKIPLTPEVDEKFTFATICRVTRGLSVLDVCLSLHVGSLDRRWEVVPRVARCNNNNNNKWHWRED